MNLESSFVASAVETQNLSSHIFSSVTTDSRKLSPGCLFVAIEGETLDGHQYISNAISQGATGILCKEDHPILKTLPPASQVDFFKVKNTQDSFRKLGAAWRKKFSIPVVLIAGSVGKTTTKELLSAILSAGSGSKGRKILKTQGSQNGFLGIPMTLLELRPEHHVAVIEVGIDEIGAMAQHLEIVNPTVALLTAIGPEHLEKLKNLQTVAREELAALFWTGEKEGRIGINLDDPWIAQAAKRLLTFPHAFSFSMNEKTANEKTGEKNKLCGELDSSGSEIKINGMGLKDAVFRLPLLGQHNAMNLLGAIGTARSLELNEDEIRSGLETFAGAEGRSQIRTVADSVQVICDYYNAQPASVEAGLALLTQLNMSRPGSKRWACLGDMLEMGEHELQLHRELSKSILKMGIEHVLLYGPRMMALHHELHGELKSTSNPNMTVQHFETHEELARVLRMGIRSSDTVLIKGSRGMKMEEVWKRFELGLKN